MSEPIRIGAQTFTARRETYELLLAREELAEREGAAVDEVNGLAVELEHAQRRLLRLADGETFDTATRDAIKAERKALRASYRTAQRELFTTRMAILAARLEPEPEAAFLLAHMDEDLLDRINDALATRPTLGPEPESDGS